MKKYYLLSTVLLICFSVACASDKEQSSKTDYVQRTLTEQSLVNLNAVNRLYGYTRYFYPNQETAKYSEIDWYKFLIYAIGETIDSKSEKELRENLCKVFKPIVPELVFEQDTIHNTNKVHKVPFYHWEYMGIGEYPVNSNIYINKIQKAERISPNLPTPDSLYSFPLGDNITAFIPLSVSSGFDKTNKEWKQLEKERKQQRIRVADRGFIRFLINRKDAKVVTLLDDKIRYADLMVRWNIIKHFYPYFKEDELDCKWNERLNQAFIKASQITDYMEYPEIVNWLMAAVNDSHIDVNEIIAFEGLIHRYIASFFPLLKVDWCEDNKIYIVSGSDSLGNKLNKGDQIVSVNGMDIDKLIEIKSEFISASSPQGKMEKLVNRELFRSYTEDTVYNIKVRNAEDKELLFTIKPTQRNWIEWENEKSSFVENLGDNIYYLNLVTFDKNHTYNVFKEFIPKLQKAKGVIVDVRGYPNASITDSIISHFSKEPVLSGNFFRPYYSFPDQKKVLYKDEGNGYLDQVPESEFIPTQICVLINHKAMSYGETVISMFRNSTNSILIGSPTIGTNGDVTMINLPLCRFTMTAVYDPDNHGVGIEPDILVYPALQDVRAGNDILLETAIEYINNLIFNNIKDKTPILNNNAQQLARDL